MDAHMSSNTKEKGELERIRKENENLKMIVEAMSNKYEKLQAHVIKVEQQQQFLMTSSSCHDPNKTPRIPWAKASHDSKLFVRTDSNEKTLVVKDGYHWRKYGQKITKDNPSPRAYFRRSMAPGCPAKKKVQRSMEDDSFIVAIYEGEHNHGIEYRSLGESLSSVLDTSSIIGSMANPFQRDITLDLTLSAGSDQQNCRPSQTLVQQDNNNSDKEKKIEEYVAFLTKDPNFTVSLAAAVARSIYY